METRQRAAVNIRRRASFTDGTYFLEASFGPSHPVSELLFFRTDNTSLDRYQHPIIMQQHCMTIRRTTLYTSSLVTHERRHPLRVTAFVGESMIHLIN